MRIEIDLSKKSNKEMILEPGVPDRIQFPSLRARVITRGTIWEM
jgi:hypothetical protein